MEKILESNDELWNLGFETIKELETERGILASGREEVYGCIFGRDSLITSLKLLRAYERNRDPYFLSLVRKVLLNLAELQGKDVNIESGEEPGKIIHEFRENGHEHLTSRTENPWYLYPDKIMRNYDSVDSTPLFLMTVSRYYQFSLDKDFEERIAPAVERALAWLLNNIDSHKCGFLSYRFHPDRKCGGLLTQSWMDSVESLFHEDGSPTPYPIAPAEAQAYAYLALRQWSKILEEKNFLLSWQLCRRAENLKKEFNKRFINMQSFAVAFALDGNLSPLWSARSSVGHLLWASDRARDSIIEAIFIPQVVALLTTHDMFEANAGIRTLSRNSKRFDPYSYHNGSIWPHDTAIVAEGFENFGFINEAKMIKESLRRAWEHYKTPVELFVYSDKGFENYETAMQKACAKQAWSAASILAEL